MIRGYVKIRGDDHVPRSIPTSINRAFSTHLEAHYVRVVEGLEQIDLAHGELERLLALYARQRNRLHGVLGPRLPVSYRLHLSKTSHLLRILSLAVVPGTVSQKKERKKRKLKWAKIRGKTRVKKKKKRADRYFRPYRMCEMNRRVSYTRTVVLISRKIRFLKKQMSTVNISVVTTRSFCGFPCYTTRFLHCQDSKLILHYNININITASCLDRFLDPFSSRCRLTPSPREAEKNWACRMPWVEPPWPTAWSTTACYPLTPPLLGLLKLLPDNPVPREPRPERERESYNKN